MKLIRLVHDSKLHRVFFNTTVCVGKEHLHLDSDVCHQRALSDAAYEYRGISFFLYFFFEGMEQRLAQHGWHYCRPLFHSFMCWWETKLFEDNADTAGVMMLWATASFMGWSCLKGRISVLPLRRETILFLQSTDGVECLTSPEVSLLMRFFFLIHVLSQITIIRHVIYVWWRVVASYTFATFSHGALK